MKLISWNVNGLRACAGKGFFDFFAAEDADIFCLGETKMQPDQAQFDTPGYHQYWNSAEKRAIPVWLSLPSRSRLPCATGWASTATTTRAGC